MICPYCGGFTKVLDSRETDDSVRRRRECRECGLRFSTTEIDLQLYDKRMEESRSIIQKEIREEMENIKKNIDKIISREVLNHENKNH